MKNIKNNINKEYRTCEQSPKKSFWVFIKKIRQKV